MSESRFKLFYSYYYYIILKYLHIKFVVRLCFRKQQQKLAQTEVHKEVNAHIAREKMRELAVNKDPPPPKKFVDYGPAPRATKPYGSWTPVVNQYVLGLFTLIVKS